MLNIFGLEVKDTGFVGKAMDLTSSPEPIRDVLNKFIPVMNKYHHTGFFSTEIRVGDDGYNYFTDPCVRAGSPPSNTYMRMISNWDELLIGGARGELIEPKFSSQYGCEIILKSTACCSNYMRVGFDKMFKDDICLKGSMIINDEYYVMPFEQAGIDDMKEFGSVSIVGNSIDEIMSKALDVANNIDCYGLMFKEDALDIAKKELQKIEEALNFKF